jgi:transcriptional regulator with XRE-family HTH domain
MNRTGMFRIARATALGAALREIRHLHKLTLPQLAKLSGIPKEMLGAYERGVNAPSQANLLRIINAYEYDLALVPREEA